MSAAPKLTKKQKKAVAFRDRKGKGKSKSAPADGVRDLPEGLEEDQDGADILESQEPEAVKPTKQKKAKGPAAPTLEAAESGKGEKTVEKTKKRKREDGDDAALGEDKPKEGTTKRRKKAMNGAAAGKANAEGVADGAEVSESADASRRFILFLGASSSIECFARF